MNDFFLKKNNGHENEPHGCPLCLERGEGARGVGQAVRGLKMHGQRFPVIALEMEEYLKSKTKTK